MFAANRRAALLSPSRAGRGRMPAGFRWNRQAYPVDLTMAGGVWRPALSAVTYKDPACDLGASLYVDIATGLDTNVGSSSLPVQSIWRAIQLGNATNAAFSVWVKAGAYPRANSFSNNGAVVPTQSIALYVWGAGRVASGPFDALSWPGSPDATHTNTWSVTRGGVARVIDLLNTDAFGHYVELANVASAAAANTTPGSWAQVSSTLYVRRADGAAVTNANTRVFLTADCFLTNQTSRNVYVGPGFDFEGGTSGAVRITGTSANTQDRIFAAEGCTARYAGSSSAPNPSWRVLDWKGLVRLSQCDGSAAVSDGFNAHYDLVDGGACHVLLDLCTGLNNGRFTSQSNNGVTMHDACSLIDVLGTWSSNRGGAVRHIDSAHAWHIGATVSGDLGDISLGGAIGPTGVRVDGQATAWLDEGDVFGSETALAAYDTATINLRRMRRVTGGQFRAAGAAIRGY